MPWGFAIAAVGALVSTVGAISSADAQSASAKYNAQVAANNATIANQNASYAAQAGSAQAEQASLQTRAKVGGIIANQAAGNIDVNSGSALDVQSSARDLGELNAITVKSNAVRQAYGYNVQSANYTAESQLDTYQAGADQTAGQIGAGGTLLSSAGTGLSNYNKFLASGGQSPF